MGAWGHGPFQNDDACDWAYGLEAAEDLGLVEATLDRALDEGEDYLESPTACEAIAACETMAKLLGSSCTRDERTEAVDRWVDSHPIRPGAELLDKAQRFLTRVTADDSELAELWQETSEFDAWSAAVSSLLDRLSTAE